MYMYLYIYIYVYTYTQEGIGRLLVSWKKRSFVQRTPINGQNQGATEASCFFLGASDFPCRHVLRRKEEVSSHGFD